jgi:hypothetical protein
METAVVACVVNMLKNLLDQRYKTSLDDDLQLLEEWDRGESKLDMRGYWALIHRINGKEILAMNIKLAHILLRILNRML